MGQQVERTNQTTQSQTTTTTSGAQQNNGRTGVRNALRGQQLDSQQQALAPDNTPPPPPLNATTAKAAVDSSVADLSDISTSFARTVVGQTQVEFNLSHGDLGVLRHQVIKAYIASADAKTTTQKVGQRDPIAIQKFADIDAERHLDPAHAGLKAQFYTALAGEMSKSTYTDRNRSYNAMKTAGPPWIFGFKGVQIPADRVSPFSARNQSVDKMFNIVTPATNAAIDAAIQTPLLAANARPETVAAKKLDPVLRKKAYRHLLASGTAPMSTINTTEKISPYQTWYAPGSIRVNPAADPNLEFSKMMTLGALQPEWYPSGTCVLNLTASTSRMRECRKPTAFDGLMSALWTARNVGANDFGVTGGGLAEFLEGNLTYDEVTSANAVIPSDAFLADMQRVASQVSNALDSDSTPTEEMLRGNRNTSIANTSAGVGGMYKDVIGATTNEQNSPSGRVVSPGATTRRGAAPPTRGAVASGGVYDRSSR